MQSHDDKINVKAQVEKIVYPFQLIIEETLINEKPTNGT
jgi:hypothetical protein